MKIFALLSTIAIATQCLAAEDEQQGLRRAQDDETDGEEGIQHYGFESRIVGGTVADAADYEWSVNLGGCGGSLIHSDIVLTAAHCRPLFPDSAKIGGNTRNGGVSKRIVGRGTKHPSYSSTSQDYDIMVYKLATPVLNQETVPINSELENPSVEGGDTLTVIGFGSTFEGGGGSSRLREVDVYHVDHDTCNTNYRGQIDEDVMFCAGVSGGGRDTCQGDSGGPIIDANGVQVGVTSWGNGCARDGFPGVYARVSAVHDWIQEQICDLSSDPPASCSDTPGDDADTGGDDTDNDTGGDDTDTDTDGDTDTGGDDTDTGGDDTDTGADDTDTDTGGDNPDSDMIQPKGITIRVDITYDEYPHENAWVLYNDDTKEELHFSEYGDVASAGTMQKVFPDMEPGRYVFLMLDEYWDGICCRYGDGMMNVYQIFPAEEGRGDELKWEHDGKFWNAAGAVFVVGDEEDRRSLRVESEDIKSSPYVPKEDGPPAKRKL